MGKKIYVGKFPKVIQMVIKDTKASQVLTETEDMSSDITS